MPRRSVLFAPGDDGRKLAKALASAADVVVLDLEDSVAPGDKGAARERVAAALAAAGPHVERVLRVNRSGPGWDPGDARLAATLVGDGRLDGVMLPKVESAGDLDAFLAVVGSDVALWPVATETAAGVLALPAIAAHPAVTAICWGAEDLSVAMGAWGSRLTDGTLTPAFLWVRHQTLFAAKAAGVDVIDTIHAEIDDDDGLRREAAAAAAAGFSGKLALHPRQVDVIHQAFRPPQALLDRAGRLLAARDEQRGAGTFRFEGQMVDQPHFLLAEQLVRLAGVHDRVAGTREGGGLGR